MTYLTSVIADNPDHYWRFNEGPGARSPLDYGIAPSMLSPASPALSGTNLWSPGGYGYAGVTADGGAMDVAGYGLWSTVPPPSGVQSTYVPLVDPGTLELWYFMEDIQAQFFVGWFSPNSPTNAQRFGLGMADRAISGDWLTGQGTSSAVSPLSQWHHIAASWSAGSGFVYVDGTQKSPLSYTGSVAGGHVWFLIGMQSPTLAGAITAGLVTEVAIYRRALTVGQLDVHFNAAELKGLRPHWLGRQPQAGGSPPPSLASYALGVTHVALTGTGQFNVPAGLRGLMVNIIQPPAGRPVLPGVPPYLFDVGWLSCLDANGMLAETRPNRDQKVWLPDNFGLATQVGYVFNPGVTVDLTELDPV